MVTLADYSRSVPIENADLVALGDAPLVPCRKLERAVIGERPGLVH